VSLSFTTVEPITDRKSAFFNDITYTTPVVPTLYSVLTTGDKADDPTVYGAYTNSHVLKKNDIIELILNSNDPGKHPFHLHGHNFQLVHRGAAGAGFYNASREHSFPATPMRRDTVMVNPNSNFVIRFRADNPGESSLCLLRHRWHTDESRRLAVPLSHQLALGHRSCCNND